MEAREGDAHGAIVEQMTCCICMDVCGTLMQCTNGHITCRGCLLQSKNTKLSCAVCRSTRGWSRNRSLERIASALHLEIACGMCTFLGAAGEIDRHRILCSKRPVDCPVCELSVTLEALPEHVHTHEGVCVMLGRDGERSEVLNISFSSLCGGLRNVISYAGSVFVFDVSVGNGCDVYFVHGGVYGRSEPVYCRLWNCGTDACQHESARVRIEAVQHKSDLPLLTCKRVYSERTVHDGVQVRHVLLSRGGPAKARPDMGSPSGDCCEFSERRNRVVHLSLQLSEKPFPDGDDGGDAIHTPGESAVRNRVGLSLPSSRLAQPE